MASLRARLHTSEELKGDALGRLEFLEAQLGAEGGGMGASHATALAEAMAQQALAQQASQAAAAQSEVVEQLRASQAFAEQLREQLAMSKIGRSSLAEELERSRSETEEARREASNLRERLGLLEQQESSAAPTAVAMRELESTQARLAQAMEQTAAFGHQLTLRDADVARLEKRVAELEAGSGAATAATSSRGRLGAASAAVGGAPPAVTSAREASCELTMAPRSLFGDTSTTYDVASVTPATVLEAGSSGGVRPIEPLRSWRGTPPAVTRQPSPHLTASTNTVAGVAAVSLPSEPVAASTAPPRTLSSSASTGDFRTQQLSSSASATEFRPPRELSSSASTGDFRGHSRELVPPRTPPQPPVSPTRAGAAAATVQPIMSRSQSVPVQVRRNTSPRQPAGFGGGGAAGSGGGPGTGGQLWNGTTAPNGVSLASWARSPAPGGPSKGHALGGGGPPMLGQAPPMLQSMGSATAAGARGSNGQHVAMMWR